MSTDRWKAALCLTRSSHKARLCLIQNWKRLVRLQYRKRVENTGLNWCPNLIEAASSIALSFSVSFSSRSKSLHASWPFGQIIWLTVLMISKLVSLERDEVVISVYTTRLGVGSTTLLECAVSHNLVIFPLFAALFSALPLAHLWSPCKISWEFWVENVSCTLIS